MGKKTKFRIKSKHLTIAIWICLLALIVIAAAPTTPTIYTTNASRFFNQPTLTCSGATDSDGDTIAYEFFVGNTIFRERFNRSDSSTIGNGWTELNTLANSAIQDNRLNQSLTAGGTATSRVNRTVTTNISNILFDISASQVADAAASTALQIRNDPNTCFQIALQNGNLVYDGGNLQAAAVNTNYRVDLRNINWGANTYDIYINRILAVTGAAFGAACTTPAELRVTTSNTGSALLWSSYYDNITLFNNLTNVVSTNITNMVQNTTSTTYNWEELVEGERGVWSCRAAANSDNSGFVGNLTINHMNFTQCTTGNTAYNATFRNETTPSQIINATVTAFDATFDSEDTGDYAFSYSTSTNKANYPFCLNPSGIAVNESSDLRYSATNFPQRQYYTSIQSLNGGSQVQQTIYLLDSASGSYVTFQVVDGSGGTISGALVSISKVISGASTTIVSGLTDSSGSITFWLDPLLSHTITATKSGYPSFSESITPTQSSYTITLGAATSNYVSLLWGISYNIEPTDIILNNRTTYTFKYNISSTYWNLTTYGFTLRNTSSGAIINTSTGSTPSGSTVTASLNTGNYTSLTMFYFYNIGGNFTNGTQTWNVKPTYQGNLSIMTFFDDLRNFTAAGFNDFGRAILSIIIILFVTGWIAWEFGIYNPTGIATVVVLLCWALEFVGLIPMLPVEVLGSQRRYLISIALTGLLIAFYIQENSR